MTVSRSAEHEYRRLPGRRSADPLPGATETSSIRIVEVESGGGRTAHLHPLSEEIIYVERGEGQVYVNGQLTRVQAGDVIHIPSATPHATIPTSQSGMRLVCFFPHGDLSQNIEETDQEIGDQGEVN